MASLYYLEILNKYMLHACLYISLLVGLSTYYYNQKSKRFYITTLLSLQAIFDTFIVLLTYTYTIDGSWMYILFSLTVLLVLSRLSLLVFLEKEITTTPIEISIVTIEVLLLVCYLSRFIDRYYLTNIYNSPTYSLIVNTTIWIIMFILILPIFIGTVVEPKKQTPIAKKQTPIENYTAALDLICDQDQSRKLKEQNRLN